MNAKAQKNRRKGAKNEKGQALVGILLLLVAVLTLGLAIISFAIRNYINIHQSYLKIATLDLAEAGIEKAVWQLNETGGSYSGEEDTSLGIGTFTVEITNINSNTKEISSTGYIPESTNFKARKTVKVKVANTESTSVAFRYGVQVGDGGLVMQNNSKVIGDVYSNGNIIGSNGAQTTGSAWVAGGVSTTPDQQWTDQNADYVFGQTSPQLDMAQSFTAGSSNTLAKVSLYLKKAGNPSDKTVRILQDDGDSPSKTVLAQGSLVGGHVTGNYSWVDISLSSPPALTVNNPYWIMIDTQASTSNYFIWGGDSTDGYTGGTAKYSSNWNTGNPTWNALDADLDFKTFLGADTTTQINLVTVGTDAHANTVANCTVGHYGYTQHINNSTVGWDAYARIIDNSTIGWDAYADIINSSTVGGNIYPGQGSPDPDHLDMPISDGQITEWKQAAESGGPITGDYAPPGGSSVSLGPTKITGNMILNNNITLTVTGTIWVQGNIDIDNNVTINLDSGYGSNSGLIVADGYIRIGPNGSFGGSGQPGSYIMLLTTSPLQSIENPAVDLWNSSTMIIFYASNGLVRLRNQVNAKEVTAYKLHLDQTSQIQYESGLANANFTNGPGAAWGVKSWQIIY